MSNYRLPNFVLSGILLFSAITVLGEMSPSAVAACQWEPGPSFPDGPRTGAAGVNQDMTLVVLGGRQFVGEGAAVDYLPWETSVWQSGVPFGEML
ncbi:MAG: hypothetical protein JSU86_20130, partial [Phycisphaerales bacterium]